MTMTNKLIIAAEVKQDLQEAYLWYDQKRTGLGDEFLASVDHCMNSICSSPEAYSLVHKRFRRALDKSFSVRNIF